MEDFKIVLEKENINNTLFFKILTEPTISLDEIMEYDFKNGDNKKLMIWHDFMKKSHPSIDENDIPSLYEKTRYHPEYAKITSISYGIVKIKDGNDEINVLPINVDGEKEIIEKFFFVMNTFRSKKLDGFLCGHYVIGHDIPFLIKRAMLYDLKIPLSITRNLKAKPWEYTIVDILNLWKFTGNSYTGLTEIAYFLRILSEDRKYSIDNADYSKLSKEEKDKVSTYMVKLIIKLYAKLKEM